VNITNIRYNIIHRKDDREADGTALLMRRSRKTTEGSNPSLSDINLSILSRLGF
jgi:hypothetical protein